jgi:hypothetical protein
LGWRTARGKRIADFLKERFEIGWQRIIIHFDRSQPGHEIAHGIFLQLRWWRECQLKPKIIDDARRCHRFIVAPARFSGHGQLVRWTIPIAEHDVGGKGARGGEPLLSEFLFR